MTKKLSHLQLTLTIVIKSLEILVFKNKLSTYINNQSML